MRKLLALTEVAIIITLLAVVACADITVPAETEPYQPIVATVDVEMPAGAEFDGQWTLDDGAAFIKVDAATIHIWAKPGQHTISFSGVWIDFDAHKFQFVQFTKPYLVGKAPDPEPEPDPIPPQPIALDGLRVLIVHESSKALPQGQQAILTASEWRARVGAGNYLILDPQTKFLNPSPWRDAMEASAGKGLPRLIISNPAKGGYIGKLPDDPEAMLKLIDEWDGGSDNG